MGKELFLGKLTQFVFVSWQNVHQKYFHIFYAAQSSVI